MTNIRNSFNRLASQLIKENKKDSAIAVLDRCLELVPNDIVPYQYFALELAESYVQAGATDKGIEMVETAYSNFDDELNYYFALEPKLLMSMGISEEIQRNMFYLQRLQQVARLAGDDDLNEKIGASLQSYFERFRNV
jgi:hypothetical protein